MRPALRFRIIATLLACFCCCATAFAGSVTLSPSALYFGNQVQGVPSATKTVTVTNGLSKALAITSFVPNLADYSQASTCPLSPATLTAGASCVITVTFTPTVLGARNGALSVNDSASGSPQKVSLNGTGVAAVTATPSSLTFASLVIGKKSVSKPVTVKNNQTTALTMTGITTSLADFTTTTTCPLSPLTLAAGATCTVSVFFTPAAAGARSGTLTIADNASVSPTVSLTGTGVYAATASPTSLTFANQARGTTSAAQTVTLTNNQTTSLTITSISSSLTDFMVTSTCPISPSKLAAGCSCTASVTFAPTATGTRTATLSFNDNAGNSPQTVSLSGTGAAATLVSIAVTPAAPSITANATQQFKATGAYTDSSTQDLTSSAAWSSSSTAIATVNSQGLATAKATGSSTITATSDPISGSAILTVQSSTASVVVSPAAPSVGLGSNMQFAATVTGMSGAVSWQVNGATGGTTALGTIDSTGLYLAPAAPPSESVAVTAMASDNLTSGAAAVTLTSPDPLGTVTSYNTMACGNRKMGGTCYQLNLSCQGVPNLSAYLVVSNPTGPMAGSVLFFTGGGGTTLYESEFTYGTTPMNTALGANYQVVQVTYGSPYNTNQPDGWLTGSTAGGGPRKSACNVATVAQWVHDNLADTTKPFCGTGNSAGGQALAYALVFYGQSSIFSLIEPTSGPPFARLDWGCEATQPKTYSSCPNANVGYSIGATNAQNFIDPSYGDTRCSSAVTSHSTANSAQFLSDSLLAPGAMTNFPNTDVHILYGGMDTSSAFNQSQTWVSTVTSAISTACITDAPHDLPNMQDAAQQIGTDILTYCVAGGH